MVDQPFFEFSCTALGNLDPNRLGLLVSKFTNVFVLLAMLNLMVSGAVESFAAVTASQQFHTSIGLRTAARLANLKFHCGVR